MKENKVKAVEIYKEVINMLGYADDDSIKRNLRYQMTFLLEQVALRKVSDFKGGKNLYIPRNDVAISGVLNHDMAEKTLKMKRKLEDFRVRTLVMKNTVSKGDIIVDNDNYSVPGTVIHICSDLIESKQSFLQLSMV